MSLVKMSLSQHSVMLSGMVTYYAVLRERNIGWTFSGVDSTGALLLLLAPHFLVYLPQEACSSPSRALCSSCTRSRMTPQTGTMGTSIIPTGLRVGMWLTLGWLHQIQSANDKTSLDLPGATTCQGLPETCVILGKRNKKRSWTWQHDVSCVYRLIFLSCDYGKLFSGLFSIHNQ
jgi:hypothetical protein